MHGILDSVLIADYYASITSLKVFFFVTRVTGRGPEQRESEKTVLYLQIIIILISYIIIKLLINENHPSQKRKQSSFKSVDVFWTNVNNIFMLVTYDLGPIL